MRRLLAIALLLLAACGTEEQPLADNAPQLNAVAGSAAVEAKSEALLAASPCYTAQINAIKNKLQGPTYYCKSATWTWDGWNLRNSDCSSTSAYGVWIPAARGNGASTCSFSVRRIDDDGNPSGYCAWKLGTVNSSNYVTITNDANSCW
jgi:hypothetical protein